MGDGVKRVTAARLSEDLLLEHAHALTLRTIDRALKGDPTALKLCLDRIYPAAKTRPVPFALRPGVLDARAFADAYADLVGKLSRGEATADEVQAVMAALDAMRNALVTAELERDVEALKAGREPEPRVEVVVPPGAPMQNPFIMRNPFIADGDDG
jgi:hypothetical protein